MTQKTKMKPYIWPVAGIFAMLLVCAILLLPAEEPSDFPEPATEASTLPPPAQTVFSPSDFAYQGEYLTSLTHPSILGIDVSTHQKEIDWQQVKAAGVEFVMIRLGYRGSVEGLLFEDEWAQTNYQGAKAAGLKVGGYFFSQSISVEEATQEAQYALEIVQGWELDMPLVYDWEFLQEDYRNALVDARMLTDCTIAFCETVEAAGYNAMVYFNPSQERDRLFLRELTDYGFWLAMYTDEMDYPYKVDMWQYTCEGTVPGITGNVDINLYFPYDDSPLSPG